MVNVIISVPTAYDTGIYRKGDKTVLALGLYASSCGYTVR
jgi:hypothetical protein